MTDELRVLFLSPEAVPYAKTGGLADVAGALQGSDPSLPPLRGVIHAAGVLHDGVLRDQKWENFCKVMEPKITGTWNLHCLTRAMPLDFFSLFSSAVSVLGSAGQANHAAASAAQDALALDRRSRGFEAMSVSWGPWSEVGAATKRGVSDRLETRGLTAMAPERAFAALD